MVSPKWVSRPCGYKGELFRPLLQDEAPRPSSGGLSNGHYPALIQGPLQEEQENSRTPAALLEAPPAIFPPAPGRRKQFSLLLVCRFGGAGVADLTTVPESTHSTSAGVPTGVFLCGESLCRGVVKLDFIPQMWEQFLVCLPGLGLGRGVQNIGMFFIKFFSRCINRYAF